MNQENSLESSPNLLPPEILEIIFAQLPLSDLLSTYTKVCKFWSEVIRNPAVSIMNCSFNFRFKIVLWLKEYKLSTFLNISAYILKNV